MGSEDVARQSIRFLLSPKTNQPRGHCAYCTSTERLINVRSVLGQASPAEGEMRNGMDRLEGA